MIEQFINHNLFKKGVERFLANDPQLVLLEDLLFVHPMDWWQEIDWEKPGIYLLSGGRQIGKTTSLKLLIREKLLKKEFVPKQIFYLPCDQVETHQELTRLLRSFLEDVSVTQRKFLLMIDEVTYVKEWDRSIKALADEGWFRRGFCIITGSDSAILKEAMGRFPGRRGEAQKTDFLLRPLDFGEYVALVAPPLFKNPDQKSEELLSCFDNYLRCGGHLKAINDLHQKGEVLPATHQTFEQWIQGDFEKKSKSPHHLRGVLKAILETSGSQVSYSSLTQRMGEISKPTFMDYTGFLERLDILFSLEAFDQNRRIGFPKKARKFHFWDPFILETTRRWLEREGLVSPSIDWEPIKVESIVAAHFKKRFSTFYWKGKGEIDVVVVLKKDTLFLEVKWTQQSRTWDVNELKKHKNGVILTRQPTPGYLSDIPLRFLPSFL